MERRKIVWIKTKHRNDAPVIDDFFFVRNKTRGAFSYWRCYTCHVTAKSIDGIITDVKGNHPDVSSCYISWQSHDHDVSDLFDADVFLLSFPALMHSGDHTHLPDPLVIIKHQFKEDLKKAVQDQPSLSKKEVSLTIIMMIADR